MTTHVERSVLLAHIDGELSAQERMTTAAHIAACAECAAADSDLRQMNAAFAASLLVIDSAEPPSWNLAAQRTDNVIPLSSRRAPARRVLSPLQRAAAIVLTTAVAASAAVIGGRELLTRDTVPDVAAPVATAPSTASVSVAPSAGRVSVSVENAAPATLIRVVLSRSGDPVVAIEGGAAPHVTAANGRVIVDLDSAAATIVVTLPAHLRSADISAAGRIVASFRDGVVEPAAALTSGVRTGAE